MTAADQNKAFENACHKLSAPDERTSVSPLHRSSDGRFVIDQYHGDGEAPPVTTRCILTPLLLLCVSQRSFGSSCFPRHSQRTHRNLIRWDLRIRNTAMLKRFHQGRLIYSMPDALLEYSSKPPQFRRLSNEETENEAVGSCHYKL